MDKHTHQYIRIRLGKDKHAHMKCAVRGCPHHLKPELAVGRFSICNRCFNEFVLTKANMQLAKPHCDQCTDSKKVKTVINIANILEEKEINHE